MPVLRQRGTAELVDLGEPGVVDVGQTPAAVGGQVAVLQLRQARRDTGGVDRPVFGRGHRPASTAARTSTAPSRYRVRHQQLRTRTTAGTTDIPTTIAVMALSGCAAASPELDT